MTRDEAIDKIVRPVFEVVSGMAFQFRMMGLSDPDVVVHTIQLNPPQLRKRYERLSPVS